MVNFDVPNLSEDYIHRVGRTARAQSTGEAWTFFAPDEEENIRTIERAVKGRLPRITLEGFDYTATGNAVEVPREERIAKIRAQRREDRQRAAAKAERGARAESDRKKGGGSERTRGGRGRSRRRGGGGSSSRAA